ncbi:hypothetical protein GGF32_002992 [Allomyces javanicus]|nr:hypothetical protein GGF32_002992 [Allomyces javanicus]
MDAATVPPALHRLAHARQPPLAAMVAASYTPAVAGTAAVVAGIAHSLLLTLLLATAGHAAPTVIRWRDASTLALVSVGSLAALALVTRLVSRGSNSVRRASGGAPGWLATLAKSTAMAAAVLAYHAALTVVHPSIVFAVMMLALHATVDSGSASAKYHGLAGDDKEEPWSMQQQQQAQQAQSYSPSMARMLVSNLGKLPLWVRLVHVVSIATLVAISWPTYPLHASAALVALLAAVVTTYATATKTASAPSSEPARISIPPIFLATLILGLVVAATGVPTTSATYTASNVATLAIATVVAKWAASSAGTSRAVRSALVQTSLAVAAGTTAAWSAPFVTGAARVGVAIAALLLVIPTAVLASRAATSATAGTTRGGSPVRNGDVLASASVPESVPLLDHSASDLGDDVALPRPASASAPTARTTGSALVAWLLAVASLVLLCVTAAQVPRAALSKFRPRPADQVPVESGHWLDYPVPPPVSAPATGVLGLDPCSTVPFHRSEPKIAEGTTALVTGGSGFIGSHLVERLLSLGYKVRILDNLATGYLHNIAHLVTHPNVEFVYGDIMDQETMLRAVQGVDYVYHLAAMSKVVPSMKDPAMARFCLDTNVGGTVNVLNASRIAGVKKVVYAASSTYYGNGKVPMNEVDPPNLLTPYSATKYEGEIQMDLYDRIFNLPTIAVRFFMVYGPRQPTTGAYAIVTGVFLKKWMDHQPLPIEGDGSHYRDFIHARDITKALILAQQSPHRAMVVNAGTGVGHSVHEVADLVSPDHKHVAERRNDVVGTLADTCKAKKVLGFEADYEFTHEMAGLIHDAADPASYVHKPEVQRTIEAHAAHPWLLPPGMLKFKYGPLVNDLAGLAAAQARDKQVTVIPYQLAFRPMLENLIYSLVKYGKTRHYIVAAMDAPTLDSCLTMNLPCLNATSYSASSFSGEVIAGQGDGWALISWIKPRVVEALLRLGYSVHLTDTDIAYVRNVWPSYMKWMDAVDADLAATFEPSWPINTGNYIARPTPTTLNFFKEYLAIGDRDPRIPDQRAFGMALGSHGGMCQWRGACAALKRDGKLALRDYSSIFGRHSVCPRDSLDLCAPNVLYVHPICMSGQEVKKRKMIQLNVWFMREVCPAGAGEDPALRKGECIGVPSTMLSDRSAGLPEPRYPADERACFGTVAQLTAH